MPKRHGVGGFAVYDQFYSFDDHQRESHRKPRGRVEAGLSLFAPSTANARGDWQEIGLRTSGELVHRGAAIIITPLIALR